MERVQYQQEEMLAELKDLIQKGLFTVHETKQILKKRTMYETALVRKAARKADFLRYAAYEMRLEQLRRKRVERLKVSTTPPTISDYAIVKRQFSIYERALKRFKSDIGLWMQYIQVAKREGARALVGRITARALQLHANTPSFYIIAASQEMKNLSPSAARTLLQRGIRLNPDSIDLWREHVRFELAFVESLRRRWEVLGVDMDGSPNKSTGEPSEEEDEIELNAEDARKEVMNGAVVKSVVTSACQAIPKVLLFTTLRDVISEHPSPPTLRKDVLDHLYGLIPSILPNDPQATKLLATRYLIPTLEGEALVEAIQQANETLQASAKADPQNEDILRVYAEFIQEWSQNETLDDALREYLTVSLSSLIKTAKSSPALLSTHLHLLSSSNATSSSSQHILNTAKKYTRRAPQSASVWLARLEAENALGGERTTVDDSWTAARKDVQGDGREEVWLWGLEHHLPDGLKEKQAVHKKILLESMQDSVLSSVHEKALASYIRIVYNTSPFPSLSTRRQMLREINSTYLPTHRTWALFFTSESESSISSLDASTLEAQEKEGVLKQVYDHWIIIGSIHGGDDEDPRIEATLAWAQWLMKKQGKAKEARDVILRARGMLGEGEKRAILDSRWAESLDEEEAEVNDDGDEMEE